ncbi:MAG: hypothetical protein ACTHLN_06410 [Tepidisphaeraceae bacterium]
MLDSNQPRPETTVASIDATWRNLSIEHCEGIGPAAESFLDAIRKTNSNGGAFFERFRLESNSTIDWFMCRNRWDYIEFPSRFLRSPAVARALPDVCKAPIAEDFDFASEGAFTLSGELAQMLWMGGAYVKHEAGPGHAFNLAEDFRRELYGDRFDEVLVLRSYKAWSSWFFDVAWDTTWLIVDKRHRIVSVLCRTDTD